MKNEFVVKYGILLKRVMLSYDIDYIDMASEINITSSSIRHWYNGRNFPSQSAIECLHSYIKKIIDFKKDEMKLHADVYTYIKENINNEIPIIEDMDFDKQSEIIIDALKYCYIQGKICKNNLEKFEKEYPSKGRTEIVIFDFDGTLTDGKSTRTTWETIWTSLGYDVGECRKLHKKFDSKEITHSEWCNITTKKFKDKNLHKNILDNISNNIQMIDGVSETFNYLVKKNIKICIVSGSILYIIKNVLKELNMYVDDIKANDFKFSSEGYLEDIIGTAYDFEGKADYVRKKAETLKISTKDILFIGNSFNDRFVHESGARTLCINPKLTDISDHIVWNYNIQECNDLREIIDYIK